MVRSLTQTDKQKIAAAITEAEKATSAEIVLVVAETSDAYQYYVLLIALSAGSLLSTILWAGNLLTAFPYLLMLQITIIALFSFTPFIRNLCVRLVPKKILQHRAAHRAYGEYITITQKVPASVPVLVLYISLTEHYAHILSDRQVREKLPDTIWDSVIAELTKTVAQKGLADACIEAIEQIAMRLSQHFPAGNNSNYLSDEVISP